MPERDPKRQQAPGPPSRPRTGPAQHVAQPPVGGDGQAVRSARPARTETPAPDPRAAPRKPAKRTRLTPARDRDGNPVCVKCGAPNHPDHPNSPYCREHYRQARRDAVAKSRADKKAFDRYVEMLAGDDGPFDDGVHVSTRGTVLLASKVAELREARGDLLAAYAQARSLTKDFTDLGSTSNFYLAQIIALKQAIEDFNEVLGPILRKPG